MRRRALAAIAPLLLAGCLSPPPPPEPITVLRLDGRPDAAAVASLSGHGPTATRLRMRHVRAPSYLDDRVVWCDGDVQIGYYGDRKWCEAPAAVVERALASALYTAGGLRRTDEKAATLEIEVTAFDDRLEPRHEAVVALEVRLAGPDGETWHSGPIVESAPVADHSPRALGRAMETALRRAVSHTGWIVAAALARPVTLPALPPPPPSRP